MYLSESDLNDKTWMVGCYVKEKPFLVFGENQSSDDIWVVKEVKDNKIICDQFTSAFAIFTTDKEFNIDDVDFV